MTPVLDNVNRYFQQRFGLENPKGEAVLQKKCWIGTVPAGNAKWKTIVSEPLAAGNGVFVLRITCETEDESAFQLCNSWQELLIVGPNAEEFKQKIGDCPAVVLG